MKITITTIEASTEDLAANRRVADVLIDAISRICDTVARPDEVQMWEEDGEQE